MWRLLGALLVITSSSLVGWMVSSRLARRPTELREMRRALDILETEMLHSAALLPHAMEKVAGLVGPPVAGVFLGAARLIKGGNGVAAGEAWAASVKEAYPATSLAPEDLHVLLELGDCLGASSRDDQERHLRRIQGYLATCEARAREGKDGLCKMWQYLGLCAGLILVILLY